MDIDCNDVKIRPVDLIRDYKAGETQTEIASKYGLSVYMVRKILMERGVDLEHPFYRKPSFE